MNKTQIEMMEHAIKNQGRYYTDADCKHWNDLVEKGFASKRPGWDKESAYFLPTAAGREAMKLTDYQLGKLKHAFGLDYSRKPYRNYYHCNQINDEWEDMCAKGFANKEIRGEREIVYFGTLKGLREVFRKNVSAKYFAII
ncbi:hypothetical protein [Cytobacillus praedii]|uniref:hypothetical protein n=1 Tax=Cytobacillus praedii TaxID=1742358 RepID=UPI002E224F16|nr:hypothetical protein [Cytobacillus praedii]